MHLLRQRSVHLLTRVVEIGLPRPGEATAQVLVAMAGSPIDGPWRVVSAAWRPAALDDYR